MLTDARSRRNAAEVPGEEGALRLAGWRVRSPVNPRGADERCHEGLDGRLDGVDAESLTAERERRGRNAGSLERVP